MEQNPHMRIARKALALFLTILAVTASSAPVARAQLSLGDLMYQERLSFMKANGFSDIDLTSPDDPRISWPPKDIISAEQARQVLESLGVPLATVRQQSLVPLQINIGDMVPAWAFLVAAESRVVYLNARSGQLIYELPVAARLASGGGAPPYARPTAAVYDAFPSGWDLPWLGAAAITCGYGCGYHLGKDYYAIDATQPEGSPVLAPASGWVVYADWDQLAGNWGYGRQVIIMAGDAGEGNGAQYIIRLSGMDEIDIKAGVWVEKGARVGTVGITGAESWPHILAVIYRGIYAGNGAVAGESFPWSWSPGVDGYSGQLGSVPSAFK